MGRVEAYENDIKKIQKLNLTSDIFISKVLEESGEVPQVIARRIENQKDDFCLKEWITLAARATSIEEFGKAIR